MNREALFRLTHGMYLLTAHTVTDNGCIVDAVMQITAEPEQILVGVQKKSLTHDMIVKQGHFCLSPLTEVVPDEIIARFGFSSGRDRRKFDDTEGFERGAFSLMYPTFASAALFCRVTQSADYKTHTLFTAEVEDSILLSQAPIMTYNSYRDRYMK